MEKKAIKDLKQSLIDFNKKTDHNKSVAKENEELKEELRIASSLLGIDKKSESITTILGKMKDVFIEALKTREVPNEVKVLNQIKEVREIEVSNFPKPVAFPKEIKVNNLEAVKIPPFPKKMEVEGKGFLGIISALKGVSGLLTAIKEGIGKAVVSGTVFIGNREPKDAIPVVLTTQDRKSFYNVMVQLLGSGGSSTESGILNQILVAIQAQSGGAATAVGDGTRTVTTAGTRVQLSVASVTCKRVIVQAHESNTGTIVIGDSTCVAALAGRRGRAIFPTQAEAFEVSDLNLLYIDSTANGDIVNYYYEV